MIFLTQHSELPLINTVVFMIGYSATASSLMLLYNAMKFLYQRIILLKAGLISIISIFFNYAVILSWFVEEPVVNVSLKGQLIEEESVECRPGMVSNAVLDEIVDVALVCRHFTNDAWELVQEVCQRKWQHPV